MKSFENLGLRIIKVISYISILLMIVSLFSCVVAEDEPLNLKSNNSDEYLNDNMNTENSDKQNSFLEREKNKENLSAYKIFQLDKNDGTNFAVAELSKYLYRSSDLKFQIIKDKPLTDEIILGNYIIVGILNDKLSKKLGINLRIYKKESFVIKKIDKSIFILGKSPVAVIFGVYSFLEKNIGIKFLSKDYEFIPKNLSKININNKDYIYIPRFIYREVFMAEGDDPNFALKIKDNGRLGHRNLIPLKFGNIFIKDFGELVPKRDYEKSHPEYFCGGQLDYTLEDVKKIALENAENKLKNMDLSKDIYFVIGHKDIGSFCYNENNKNRINEGGSPATPYLDFVSYLAKHLKDRYPNIKILASAYLWSLKPPTNYENLPSNMGVFFAPIGADFSKPLNSQENKKFFEYLKGWTKISNHIFIWHYITNFNNYFQPYPNIYSIAQDIKTFSKISQIEGIFLEGAYGSTTSDLADLKLWLFSKLLWNPNQNVDESIVEFTDKFYGDAAPYIREYIKLLYETIEKHPTPLYVKVPPNLPYLNLEFFIKAEDLFKKALKSVAGNEELTKHVKKAKLSVDVMLLLNKGELQEEANIKNLPWFSKNFLEKLLKDTEETIKRERIKSYSEGGKIEDLLKILRLERKPAKSPEEVKGLKKNVDWFDFQEYTLTNCCGAKLEYDNLASDGVAVSMPGNTTAWGIQLNLSYLPKGKWNIYFRIRISLKDNPNLIDRIKLAFRYGVYPITRSYLGLINSYMDQEYHTVRVGTFERKSVNLWIAPPGNEAVEKIYVDRIFIIKADD